MQFLQDPIWYNIFSLSVVMIIAIIAFITIVIINELRYNYYRNHDIYYTYIDKYRDMNKDGVSIPITDKIPILSDEADKKGEIDISFDNMPLHGATIVTLSVNLLDLDASLFANGSSLHFFGSVKLLEIDILDTKFSWSYETGKDSEDFERYDWRREQLVPEEGLKVYGQMIRLGGNVNRSLIASGIPKVTLNVLLTGAVDRVEMHYDTWFRKPYRFK